MLLVRLALPAALVVALASAALANGAVRQVSLTRIVQPGAVATLTIAVEPRERCRITLAPRTVVASRGLAPKTGGRITWRWTISRSARPGPSPVLVRCGASGLLLTAFQIERLEPELSLSQAAAATCARAPERASRRYRTQLVPLLERTVTALREQYGPFSCAFGSNYYRDGGPLSYYLLSVRRGTERCAFTVTARVVWIGDPPLPGYAGPVDETYTETCASLRT